MNQKVLGITLIIISIFSFLVVYANERKNAEYVELLVEKLDSCFLDDGTCLHEEQSKSKILGYVISSSILLLGIYLIFFDQTQKLIENYQNKISNLLDKKSDEMHTNEKFKAFLAGFDSDKQMILKQIKEQEGIEQATLRYKTNFSKTTLSMHLKDLEEKEIINKVPYKKTNKIYLIKKF